jgi:hypothetical protein
LVTSAESIFQKLLLLSKQLNNSAEIGHPLHDSKCVCKKEITGIKDDIVYENVIQAIFEARSQTIEKGGCYCFEAQNSIPLFSLFFKLVVRSIRTLLIYVQASKVVHSSWCVLGSASKGASLFIVGPSSFAVST